VVLYSIVDSNSVLVAACLGKGGLGDVFYQAKVIRSLAMNARVINPALMGHLVVRQQSELCETNRRDFLYNTVA